MDSVNLPRCPRHLDQGEFEETLTQSHFVTNESLNWNYTLLLSLSPPVLQDVFTYHYANCTHAESVTYCNDSKESFG